MGLIHTKLKHKANFMVNEAANEQLLNVQLREIIDSLGEALSLMSTAMEQETFDAVLDREDIDAYQLLEKMSDDLMELAASCQRATGSEYLEIDYDYCDEEDA